MQKKSNCFSVFFFFFFFLLKYFEWVKYKFCLVLFLWFILLVSLLPRYAQQVWATTNEPKKNSQWFFSIEAMKYFLVPQFFFSFVVGSHENYLSIVQFELSLPISQSLIQWKSYSLHVSFTRKNKINDKNIGKLCNNLKPQIFFTQQKNLRE